MKEFLKGMVGMLLLPLAAVVVTIGILPYGLWVVGRVGYCELFERDSK